MNKIRRCQPLCGTYFEVELSSFVASEEDLLLWSTKAFEKALLLEKTFSPFDSSSELSEFNQLPSGHVFQTSDLFYKALAKTQLLFSETKGLFTPYKESHGINFLLESENKVLKTGEAELNLNGFIKGWIVDEITKSLVELGCDCVFVNGGGDLRYWFKPVIKEQLTHPHVGIRDLEDPNKVMNILLDQSTAVATSANYSYDFEHAKNYSIRFVNKSEEEARHSSFFSATVMAPSCWIADALTKVLAQDIGLAEQCAKKWDAKFYFKSREQELCFALSKT